MIMYQPIKFKRNEKSDWETGSMYIKINSSEFVIEDTDSNQIQSSEIFDYIASWYGDV